MWKSSYILPRSISKSIKTSIIKTENHPILILGDIMKKEDYQRQLIIANSLYELGIDVDLIKTITTVAANDLLEFRKKQDQQKHIIFLRLKSSY